MNITESDIQRLINGSPPLHDELLKAMTIGREKWLDRMRSHYLENYFSNGGSKVKVLTGKQGTGKTHALRCVLSDAKFLGYATVYLSARNCRLNDLVSLYREIVDQLDKNELVTGLCRNVASQFIDHEEYDSSELFVTNTNLYERYPTTDSAAQAIQKEVTSLIREADLSSSFKTFIYRVICSRMISNPTSNIDILLDWLSGKNDITRRDCKALSLFDKLDRTNARDWLNSLIQLLKLAGKKGLIIAIDDLEVITEKSLNTGRFSSKLAIMDIYELIRQLIDDTEVLAHCLFLFAGDHAVIDDPNRGFKSYDALWIRLQTGLIKSDKFNAFADLVDIDQHLESQGKDFPNKVRKNLEKFLNDAAIDREEYKHLDGYRSKYSDLQQRVIEAVCSRKSK